MGTITGNVSLSDGNFQEVDFAVETASVTKIMGFGGTKQEFLVLEAKQNLYAHNDFKKGQALSNVTVDFCKKNYVLFSKTKVTVSAEVVDFNSLYDEQKAIQMNKILKSKKLFAHNGFHIEDHILFKTGNVFNDGVVVELQHDKVLVKEVGNKKDGMLTVRYSDLLK